jgi:hypothetical protein
MAYLNEILCAKDDMRSISHEEFKKWSESTFLEDLEELTVLLFDKSFCERVKPFLSLEDYQRVLLPYFRRCIIENHDDKNISTRYEACWALRNWFEQLWRDREENNLELTRIKEFISDLYKSSDENIKLAIISGTLEHLFEANDIASFFVDWKECPLLSKAYDDALAFSK